MVADYKKKVLNGFAWESATKIVVQVLSWVSTIIVARILSPEDYGLILIAGIFTGIFAMLANLGLSSGIVNRDTISIEEQSALFWLSTIAGLFFYSVLYVLAIPISAFYEIPELEKIIQVSGLIIVLSTVNIVPHAMMMRELRFKFAAVINLFSQLILIGITLYMAYAGYEYWSLVVSTLISQGFVFLAYLIAIDQKPQFKFHFKPVMDVMKFGSLVLGSRLLMYWNNSSAATVVSVFLNKIMAGHLQMANTLATIPLTKVGEIFDKIAFPAISAIKGDKIRAKRVFLLMHKYLLLITAPMFIGIAVTSEHIVSLFLGEKWLLIVMPLQLLCLINVFRVSNQLIPRILEGMGNPKSSLMFQFVMSIACPIGMLLGISNGLNGILIGWLASMPIVYGVLFVLAKRELGFSLSEYLSTVIHPIAGCAVIFIIASLLQYWMVDYSHVYLLVAKILSCVIGFLLYFILFNPNQIREIINELKGAQVNERDESRV